MANNDNINLSEAARVLANEGVDRLLADVANLATETREAAQDAGRVAGGLSGAAELSQPPETVGLQSSERRVVSETGGAKGEKDEEWLRLPLKALAEVAKHFKDGSVKYPDAAPGVANWQLGYPWSSSLNALFRHACAWALGDDIDPEFNRTHLAAVVFHALVLMTFESEGWGTDDRYTPANRERYVSGD